MTASKNTLFVGFIRSNIIASIPIPESSQNKKRDHSDPRRGIGLFKQKILTSLTSLRIAVKEECRMANFDPERKLFGQPERLHQYQCQK